MDKSWIDLHDRRSKEYIDGVERFLQLAFANKDSSNDEIYCPCSTCVNRYCHRLPIVRMHIERKGFDKNYKAWIYHEHNDFIDNLMDDIVPDDVPTEVDDSPPQPNMVGMLQEAVGNPSTEEGMRSDEPRSGDTGAKEDQTNYYKRLKEAESPLYEGCPKGTTELSFIVEMLHIKQLNGWSNHSFTMLIKFLKVVFPHAKIPTSYYRANKLTSDLGFQYETWDACPEGCMLFKNDDKDLQKCSICESPRYKDVSSEGEQGKKVAGRQIRYFPLKYRLQKLFWSSHTSPLMKWHAERRIDDGVMRHPADSRAWKHLDQMYPSFSSEKRNVRLGLATDGFNPFNNMSTSHSTWPVVLIPYNLPPWLCMKQPYFILSMLIDGPHEPGNKIDVFLQPLIEELKELWDVGIPTYDMSSKETFQMRAAILWTISDFPAYANLSGWSTKGEFACPYCNVDHQSTWLENGGKFCYWGHRRFLPKRHRLRGQKASFDGKVDLKLPPAKLSGSQVLHQLNDLGIEREYVKEDIFRKRKREEREKEVARKTKKKPVKTHNWKKKSIFFELPYWEHNLIRHNLDIMHIEKNICDNVLYTLLGAKDKTKDNLKARKDLREMGIRKDLHPQSRGANLEYLPYAEFTLGKKEKELFLKVLKYVRFPDGYSSNISRCVNLEDRTIKGLKSHDNHILLQQLIPIAIRNLLPDHVVRALIELSNIFVILCSSVNTISDVEKLEDRIALMLCSLEKIFPPSFFDVMEHLPIHLADELLVAGLVVYRWMYPIERYLQTLKHYVSNRARSEASIAKSIILEECMTFCSRYLNENVETRLNRPIRNDDLGIVSGSGVGDGVQFSLDDVTREQAHRYVLTNHKEVKPFIAKHIEELLEEHPNSSQRHLVSSRHNKEFTTWFKNYVKNLPREEYDKLSEEVKNMALGTLDVARRFQSYIINGFRYRILDIDKHRRTQNSGVIMKATQMSYASRRDTNPLLGNLTFYGQLTDIIELHYLNNTKFVLFKCNWINVRGGKRVDKYDFTLVNFNHLLYKDNEVSDEPFILASQAEQVFYVPDVKDPNWQVVVQMKPRNQFGSYSIVETELENPQIDPFGTQQLDLNQRETWVRQDEEGELVDTTIRNEEK